MKSIWDAFVERIIRILYHDEKVKCEQCEYLKLLLDKEKQEKMKLVEMLTTKPEVEQEVVREPQKPITRNVPWAVLRQQLEANDRAKAAALRQEAEEKKTADKTPAKVEGIEALEEELGIAN